ncbi:MAG: hypothetical protein NT128_03120 [Proteobacteria bacterium]|nr:hypothetical protein [Pseudomonadota bacterium]
MIILQKNLMQFCKKILQTSALLICFNISTDLLASDDAEKTPSGKTAIVLGNIHEDWFAAPLKAPKVLSAHEQEELQRSFQLEKFRKSFTASGLAEIFGVGRSLSL